MQEPNLFRSTVAIIVGFLAVIFWTRITVRESGHGFEVGDYLILGEYGYSHGGDRLRFAIFRTWPKDSTPAQRALDTRTGRDFLGWPLIRDKDGRQVFFGRADLSGVTFNALAVADPVAFELIEDQISGPRGVRVRKVDKKR